jgi:hypothetical protein
MIYSDSPVQFSSNLVDALQSSGEVVLPLSVPRSLPNQSIHFNQPVQLPTNK